MPADVTVGGQVGESRTATGVPGSAIRQGPYAEVIVNDVGLGRYFEATRINRQFSTFVRAVTVAATHNTPIAAATATPVIGIFNPIGNTKAAVIQRVCGSTISGTPAGGQFVFNAIQATTAPVTTAGNIFNGLLNASTSPQGSTMRPFNNTALTGLLPVVGNEIMLVGGGQSAIAVASQVQGGSEDLAGAIVVPPGFLLALMAGTGAGTSWIVNASVNWAEIDWPLS